MENVGNQIENFESSYENENENGSEFVVFCVKDQEYCVDIMSVREIRGWTEETRLPNAPDYVKGIINLRGTVLPIVDLAKRLGMPAVEPTQRHVIILLQMSNQVVGLLVDSVSDIMAIASDNIQVPPDVTSTIAKSFIGGVVAIEERMISLLALDNILPKIMEDSEAA